jgi:hypothetical protein
MMPIERPFHGHLRSVFSIVHIDATDLTIIITQRYR